MNKNIIDRYSNGDKYSIRTFISHSDEICFLKERGNKKLLFIKSPFLSNNPSRSNVEHYLKETKEFVNRELPSISKDAFLAIQTQDVRIDGYVEPLAKRLVDMLTLNNLWLN
ncbi:MAG: hypothetical protein AB1393_04425 [Candidatus Edwardsbacteria bacterium]